MTEVIDRTNEPDDMFAAAFLSDPAAGMKRKASTCPHCGELTGRCFERCAAIRVTHASKETAR